MKTFEISYTYNYRPEISKIFKATDGLDAIDAVESWVNVNINSIEDVKLQEIHLGYLSTEGRVSHHYGAVLLQWNTKNKSSLQKIIENSKQKWINQLNKI
ncbi:MAG: hypothetical protein ACC656_15065 [Candidatus Heimdallarchaeota archaeon]